MKLKFKSYLDFFILFIIITKVCFLFFAIGDSALHHSTNNYIQQVLVPKFGLWRSISEIIYVVSMGILLIYIFKIREGGIHGIEDDVSFLFFLFGIVLILTADWSVFFKNYTWYQKFIKFITVNDL
jgi:hypothetical protein